MSNAEKRSDDSSSGGPLSPSDRSLVRLVRDGDPEAAELLYERYSDRLMGLVRSQMGALLRSKAEPQDVVQSVFRTMLRRVQAGLYDAPDGKTLWGLLALTTIRKLQSYSEYWSAQRRDPKRLENLDPVAFANSVAGPELPSETFELTIRETFSSLREFDRQVLALRLEHHTVEEISERVGRSRRSVERSLTNIRRILSADLLDDDSDAD